MKDKVFIKLKDKETGLISKPIPITELIFDQDEIEFQFPKDKDGIEGSLPYKDFLFFRNDYEVIVNIKPEKE